MSSRSIKCANFMNKLPASTILGLLMLLLCLTGCQTTGRSEADARAHLGKADEEWDRLFNAGDARGLAALYAEDVVSMPPNLPTISGRAALQKDFETFFSENSARHQTIIDQIIVEGDMAIERGRYKMTFKPKAGGAEVSETGRHVEIRRRINGEWKIFLEIWNTESAPK
jgi:ketosteroid isomerase-like protein